MNKKAIYTGSFPGVYFFSKIYLLIINSYAGYSVRVLFSCWGTRCNPSIPNAPFLYPLKTQFVKISDCYYFLVLQGNIYHM